MKLYLDADSIAAVLVGMLRKAGRPSSAVSALARHVTESIANLNPSMMAAE